MIQKADKGDTRTEDQLRQHYEVEKELADQLRKASKEERRSLYASLYDEMYRRVPLHPQLTRKSSSNDSEVYVARKIKLIKSLLKPDITFLEVGPGDCSLSFEVAKFVKQVYAVDVSDEISKSLAQPPNFKLILSDGTSVPLPPNSVDIAYSHQLMEHLHQDDAFEQLQNIYSALSPGGSYFCLTPNRLNGPHDVSKHFEKAATGFHMKEYTTSELSKLFYKVGFSKVRVYLGGKGKHLALPGFPVILYEKILDTLPHSVRMPIVRTPPFMHFLGTRVVGIK